MTNAAALTGEIIECLQLCQIPLNNDLIELLALITLQHANAAVIHALHINPIIETYLDVEN